MSEGQQEQLTRRERQIMDAVYALGEATVNEVVDHLEEPDAYDSIRVILGNLEKKGFLTHQREGRSYVYAPAVPREKARKPVMSHLLETFFAGSSSRAILAFLDMSKDQLTREELEEISAWIDARVDSSEEDR